MEIDIGEDGMHEVVEGQIESFVPWSGVKGFRLTPERLFIELAGDLCAIVPKETVVQGPAGIR